MLHVIVAGCLFAAAPFLDGYSLNEGRRIAFTQALPRMRNAETGKSCGMFNNKDLAIPGILTTRDPSFGAFLHRLRNVINDERAVVFVDGRKFMVNKNWIRDHVQSPAKKLDAHVLLPRGRTVGKVLVNGTDQAFTVSTVGESVYVDFVRTGTGLYDIEILFR